jgi:hypothetical protein
MVGKLLRIQGGNDWKYSHMVGKSLTWSENYSGWKATNSNMVGNFPQGVRKGVPSHRTFSLVHPSYRREFPILFSISAGHFQSMVDCLSWQSQSSQSIVNYLLGQSPSCLCNRDCLSWLSQSIQCNCTSVQYCRLSLRTHFNPFRLN